MKFLGVFLICCSLVAATIGAAAPVTSVSGTPYSLSVDNRIGKHFFTAAELSAPGTRLAPGVRVGYFLTPDSVFEMSHVAFEDDVGSSADIDARQTSASFKTFLANSLLVGAGAIRQEWGFNQESNVRTSLAVHVGNQWQWAVATVGCDWLSYLWPVHGSAAASDAAERFQYLRTYAGISF